MHSRRRTHSEAAEPVDRWATRCRSQELRHGFLFSRSVRQGDNTGVDLVCTYRKEPSSPDLDRVGLYHEVSNKTSAITHLGPYSLDRTSLYVNGECFFFFSVVFCCILDFFLSISFFFILIL